VLALPYAFRAAGVFPALCVCFCVWLASTHSFMLLARCAEALQRYSYKEVALCTYGPFAANFSEGAILLYTLGNLIGRQIILGDLLPPLLQVIVGEDAFYAQRSWVMAFVTWALLIPVSLSPYIDSLKWSSLFGLLCMCYVVVLFIVYFTSGYFVEGSLRPAQARPFHGSMLSLMAFPLLVVSFTAHYNTMDMYWELKDRSIGRMQTVVHTSTGICLGVYMVVGLCGYLLFMDETQPNILVNFWTDRNIEPNVFITLAFIAICLAVSFSFPLVCHGARNSVKKLFFSNPYLPVHNTVGGSEDPDSERCFSTAQFQHVSVTVAVILLSFFVGLAVPDIGVVFAFMGSTVGVCFVYILPALFYLKVHQMVNEKSALDHKSRHKYLKTSKLTFACASTRIKQNSDYTCRNISFFHCKFLKFLNASLRFSSLVVSYKCSRTYCLWTRHRDAW